MDCLTLVDKLNIFIEGWSPNRLASHEAELRSTHTIKHGGCRCGHIGVVTFAPPAALTSPRATCLSLPI
jgi:hypothetical protein